MANFFFEGLIKSFPQFLLERYLATDAEIITSKEFKSGCRKILCGEQQFMTTKKELKLLDFAEYPESKPTKEKNR